MINCAIVLFRLVLFRRFTKRTRLVGSNKILIDSMSLNFIDSVVIQMKDIIESNRIFSFAADKYLIARDLFDSIKLFLSV